MTETNIDRRVTPRVQASLHLHLIYEDLDQLIESYSHDVSEGGVFIETDSPLPIGSRVRLQISLVHEELIYIDSSAEVVHSSKAGNAIHGPGMGVRFLEISPEGQKFIREFVLSRIKQTAPAKKKTGGAKKKPDKGAKR